MNAFGQMPAYIESFASSPGCLCSYCVPCGGHALCLGSYATEDQRGARDCIQIQSWSDYTLQQTCTITAAQTHAPQCRHGKSGIRPSGLYARMLRTRWLLHVDMMR